MRRPRIAEYGGLALALLLAAGHAAAQFRTPADTALPRGESGCSFLMVPGVQFGAYEDGATSDVYSGAAYEIKCKGTGNTPIILASGPSGCTGDYQDRCMQGPHGSVLRYQLFTDRARTIVWGDGARGSSPIVIQQSGSNKSASAYATLYAGQTGEQGEYYDAIVITVLP